MVVKVSQSVQDKFIDATCSIVSIAEKVAAGKDIIFMDTLKGELESAVNTLVRSGRAVLAQTEPNMRNAVLRGELEDSIDSIRADIIHIVNNAIGLTMQQSEVLNRLVEEQLNSSPSKGKGILDRMLNTRLEHKIPTKKIGTWTMGPGEEAVHANNR